MWECPVLRFGKEIWAGNMDLYSDCWNPEKCVEWEKREVWGSSFSKKGGGERMGVAANELRRKQVANGAIKNKWVI